MTHTKHLWRVALLLILAAVGGVVGRHFLIPPTFGATGFYRADSLKDHMSTPVIHGTRTSCTACHAEIAQTALDGKHAGLSCEACHAPETKHARGEEKIADMPSTKTSAQCALCHAPLRARPKSQHQIVFSEHMVTLGVAEPGEQVPDDACYTCHDPHSPALGDSNDEQPEPSTAQ